MKHIRLASLFLVAGALNGCAALGITPASPYGLAFAGVDRAATEDVSAAALPSAREEGATDDAFSFRVSASADRLSVVVVNRTDVPARILWEDASYVDTDGSTSHVMRQSTRFAEQGAAQSPSVVPAGGTVEERVIPASLIRFRAATFGGWDPAWLLSDKAAVGQRVGLRIPVEVSGERREYTAWLVVQPNRLAHR
ncbi:hypothetical protein [Longimicrobium sp.]|uniref:hypothetical protein n=1 Tax=Longimicrobium sp. TaxID=2029185 RepID=UPI002E376027|nr:hypothetical protein [Longimicrobium sp.]HEX6040130.1 hypothetical protein [Longimicrobium sp.]